MSMILYKSIRTSPWGHARHYGDEVRLSSSSSSSRTQRRFKMMMIIVIGRRGSSNYHIILEADAVIAIK